jgi:hypothetical protein
VTVGILSLNAQARAETPPHITLVPPPVNVYGETTHTQHVSIAGDQTDGPGTLNWQLGSGDPLRTIARGQSQLQLADGRAETDIVLSVPPVKPGIAVKLTLRLELTTAASRKPDAAASHDFWVFPPGAFDQDTTWLESLHLKLYDPDGKTETALKTQNMPIETLRTLDSLGEPAGMLVTGAELAMTTSRSTALLAQARRGWTVLIIEPGAGRLVPPLPGQTGNTEGAVQWRCRSNDIIRELDKRLDATFGADDGARAILAAQRATIVFEFEQAPADGWPWVEIDVGDKGGKLILCGFPIVSAWETGPTARYLLRAIFASYQPNHQTPETE